MHDFLESLIADSLVLDADTLFLTQVAFHTLEATGTGRPTAGQSS